jgi:hypothetical protein
MTKRFTPEEEAEFKRRRKGRNLVVALILAGFAVLFFFITIAQFGGQQG